MVESAITELIKPKIFIETHIVNEVEGNSRTDLSPSKSYKQKPQRQPSILGNTLAYRKRSTSLLENGGGTPVKLPTIVFDSVDDGTKHAVVDTSSLFKRPSVVTKLVQKISNRNIVGVSPFIRQRALSFNNQDEAIHKKNESKVELTFEMEGNALEQRIDTTTNYQYNEEDFRSDSLTSPYPGKKMNSPTSALNADLAVTLTVLKGEDKKTT